MSYHPLRLFSTLIMTLTVGILGAALLAHIPGGAGAIVALVLRPTMLHILPIASIGCLALVDVLFHTSRTPLSFDAAWHMALFPTMPLPVGIASSDDAE